MRKPTFRLTHQDYVIAKRWINNKLLKNEDIYRESLKKDSERFNFNGLGDDGLHCAITNSARADYEVAIEDGIWTGDLSRAAKKERIKFVDNAAEDLTLWCEEYLSGKAWNALKGILRQQRHTAKSTNKRMIVTEKADALIKEVLEKSPDVETISDAIEKMYESWKTAQ